MSVQRAQARQDIRIHLPNQIILGAPVGTNLETFLQSALAEGHLTLTAPLIAAICDGRLRELSYVPERDAKVQAVTLSEADGRLIYRRSLVLLLVVAAQELFSAKIIVSYAVPDGGLMCEVQGIPPLTSTQISALEQHMHNIVQDNNPIIKQAIALDDAEALFEARADVDKVRLLQYRTRDTLSLYSLRGYTDYYYGFMVPSTAYLSTFRLIPEGKRFILQYPRQESPQELKPMQAYHKLSQAFQQTEDWLSKMGVEDIGRLNNLTKSERLRELILVAEALHEQHIANIAAQIAARHAQGLRVVLIAGPSSSGKTTFSKRLAIQLLAHGLQPFTLEMDMYFVDRHLTPRDEHGDFDFESLEAINLALFNEHLARLLEGESVQLPHFDFIEGRSLLGKSVQLEAKQIIITEGIHGLNPRLITTLDAHSIYRVYVSALAQINVDNHNRVSTTDVRLLRRIVRDARTRGYDANATLQRWDSVRRGEKRNIFPFQENADVMFNSSLVYELAALRPIAEPLLLRVEPNTPSAIEARRLLAFLSWVVPMTTNQLSFIPDTSLLREFVGGSILEGYHPNQPLNHF